MAHMTWELLPIYEEGHRGFVYCFYLGEKVFGFLTDKK